MHCLSFRLNVFLYRFRDVLKRGANNKAGSLFSYPTYVVQKDKENPVLWVDSLFGGAG